MATYPPNILEIIKQEIDSRIKHEVDDAIERIVKEIKEKEPEILAKLSVDISMSKEIQELGNIIRFDIRK